MILHGFQNQKKKVWDTREIREVLLVGLEDWELKNTDFSRKIKILDWCILQ